MVAAALGAVAAVLAVECEDAVALVRITDVELVLHPFAAERNLVFTLYPRHIVADRPGVVVEVGNGIGSAADRELAFGHLQSVRDGLVDINAQCGGVDVVGGVAAIVYAAKDGDVRCVHELGADV
jgi:hypothetical protein